MRLMKDMDVSSFPKDQRKKIRRIAQMTPFEIIKGISSFYTCPDSCNAQCCTNFDIPLNQDDKARISKKGIGYRKIIKEQIKTQTSMIDDEVFVEDVFTTRPCPFLKNNRCSIHKINPLICSIYPFKVNEKSKSMLEIVACKMGAEILIDYSAFEVVMAMHSQDSAQAVPAKMTDAVMCMKNIEANGSIHPETSIVYGIENFESLRYFLLYLMNESRESILEKRAKLKELAKNVSNGANEAE